MHCPFQFGSYFFILFFLINLFVKVLLFLSSSFNQISWSIIFLKFGPPIRKFWLPYNLFFIQISSHSFNYNFLGTFCIIHLFFLLASPFKVWFAGDVDFVIFFYGPFSIMTESQVWKVNRSWHSYFLALFFKIHCSTLLFFFKKRLAMWFLSIYFLTSYSDFMNWVMSFEG